MSNAPYLYRHLIPVLPETGSAGAFVAHVRDEEAQRGGSGEIALIGRRVVAALR